MRIHVRFSKAKHTFKPSFGEVIMVSDDGYERGYSEGYDEGEKDGLAAGHAAGKAEGEQIGYNNAVSKLTDLEVTKNGHYKAEGENIGFSSVNVNVSGRDIVAVSIREVQ